MADQHQITPPPELVRQWCLESEEEQQPTMVYSMVGQLAIKAARWGADRELKACCEWLKAEGYEPDTIIDFRAARRPTPPSLKEQALGALGRFNTNAHTRADEMTQDFDTIRRALEALDD